MQQAATSETARADRLVSGLRDIIAGNKAEAQDVIAGEAAFSPCVVAVSVVWSFRAEVSTETVLGDDPVPDGFHAPVKELEHVYKQRIAEYQDSARHDASLQEKFVRRVANGGQDALRESDKSVPLGQTGEASITRVCSQCKGKKNITCSSCNGKGKRKITCPECGGTGSVGVQDYTQSRGDGYVPTISRTCGRCHGWFSQTEKCDECNGKGKIVCPSCEGEGLFTEKTRVHAVAVPSWAFAVQNADHGELLHAYLQNIGLRTACEILAFTRTGGKRSAADAWRLSYRCDTEVVALPVAVCGRQYGIAAVGDHPHAFVRPSIFDDLLHDELAAADTQGKLNDHTARKFFERYRKYSATDRALQNIAGNPGGDNPALAEQAVFQACGGYVSQQAAATLGNLLARILQKISPAFSWEAWALVMAPVAAASFIASAGVQETCVSILGIVFFLLLTIAGVLAGGLAASPLAWLLSAVISKRRREQVPEAYRQEAQNWKPLKTVCHCLAWITVCGVVYAAAVRHGLAPSVRGFVPFLTATQQQPGRPPALSVPGVSRPAVPEAAKPTQSLPPQQRENLATPRQEQKTQNPPSKPQTNAAPAAPRSMSEQLDYEPQKAKSRPPTTQKDAPAAPAKRPSMQDLLGDPIR